MDIAELDDSDPEVKRPPIICVRTSVESDAVDQLFESISDWTVLRRTVVGLLKFKAKRFGKNVNLTLHLDDLLEAEQSILRFEQGKEFSSDLALIRGSFPLPKKSKLKKYLPFSDKFGVLRVGGRLSQAGNLTYDQRHPILMGKGHVSTLIVRSTHALVGHITASVIMKLGERYRIVGEGFLIKKILGACVFCRKYQGKVEEEVMATLPRDRLTKNLPPFTNTGIEMFGPFKITRGGGLQDRYGLLFRGLASRAAHIEIVHDKSTDSFIQALRIFIARRGQVTRIRSDNGTNFAGAGNELQRNLDDLNKDVIAQDMMTRGIEWIFNSPYSHHFGGVWEREIRTIRKTFAGLMSENRRNLTDESFNTLMCEVEAILNSRPLIPLSDDLNDLEPVTPNHLLLQRGGATFPPGIFQCSDQYAKQHWRQVQHLADIFWKRWSKEYISNLICRKKWSKERRNVAGNDLVLMVEESAPRYQWPLGRVVEVFPDSDGYVRKAKIKTAKSEYLRPISQLVVLLPCE